MTSNSIDLKKLFSLDGTTANENNIGVQNPSETVTTQEEIEIFEKLCVDSLVESQEKQAKLRAFYKDPFHNGSKRFYLAEYCLDYLGQFKKTGDKRKDKYTENILHEVRASVHAKHLLDMGLLPKTVTYQMVDGAEIPLKPEEQSIELLFVNLPLHDLKEDKGVKEDHLVSTLKERIQEAPKEHQESCRARVKPSCDALELITYHKDNDYNLYIQNLPEAWSAILAKTLDRLDGITTRCGRTADFFSIEQNKAYLKDTLLLFFSGQPVEKAAARYPELKPALNYINAQLSVAVRVFEVITEYHPENPDRHNPYRKSTNPETAPLDIEDRLNEVFMYHNPEESPILRLLDGVLCEVARHPQLKPIAEKFQEHVERSLKRYGHQLPEPQPSLKREIPKEALKIISEGVTNEFLNSQTAAPVFEAEP